jgi:hypothetical protein
MGAERDTQISRTMPHEVWRRGAALVWVAWVAGVGGLTGACGHSTNKPDRTGYVVYEPPPPRPKSAQSPPSDSRHGPNDVWVEGYWDWDGARWIWVPGNWVEGKPGMTYVADRWVRRGKGWVLVPGGWHAQPAQQPPGTSQSGAPPARNDSYMVQPPVPASPPLGE